MRAAPILVPNEPDVRFVWGDAAHAVERLPIIPPSSLRFDTGPFVYAPMDFHTVECNVHSLPRIGWEGHVFARREDADRLSFALRLAAAAILFVDWLRDFTPRVSKPGL